MKKFIWLLAICMSFVALTACGNRDHTGEAQTPSGSSIMEGQNYEDVIAEFEENGFKNVRTEKIEDLIFGLLNKDGEVEEVSVGGEVDYSPDEWVPDDTEVIVRYHTFAGKNDSEENETLDNSNQSTESVVEKETQESDESEVDIEPQESTQTMPDEILTVDNCKDLADILSNKAESDESYSAFASKYENRTIEFAGRVDCLANHGSYKTRYDILVSAGDYDPDHQTGPTFKFEDVAAYDLKLDTLFLEEAIQVGMNVKIIAVVGEFNSDTGLFFLDPVSVTKR